MEKHTLTGAALTDLILAVFRLNGLLLEKGDQMTRPVGLTSARWQVLGVVEHEAIPVAHVARVMGLSRQSVQQTADALARDGLIAYRENPHHRRAKLMIVTPAGHEALQYVKARQTEWANLTGRSYAVQELLDVTETLRQLSDRLESDLLSGTNSQSQEGE